MVRTVRIAACVLATAAIIAVIVGCGGSSSDEPDISVSGAWSRPVETMSGEMDSDSDAGEEAEDEDEQMDHEGMSGPTGVVYLSIENSGDAPDTLTGASSEVSEFTEIHESAMSDGVMQMRPVTDLKIGGGETIDFEPGGYHIMLIGLTEDLKIGDEFEVTLEFEESGSISVMSEVRESE